MTDTRGPAADPAPVRSTAPENPAASRARMPAAFATALAGGALIVGTVVTVVIVVAATAGG